MENIHLLLGLIGVFIGLALGAIIAWLYAKQSFKNSISLDDYSLLKANLLDVKTKLTTEIDKGIRLESELVGIKNINSQKDVELRQFTSDTARLSANLESCKIDSNTYRNKLQEFEVKLEGFKDEKALLGADVSEIKAMKTSADNDLKQSKEEIKLLKAKLEEVTDTYNKSNENLAEYKAKNSSLNEKLLTQKHEIEDLGKKFNLEFQNIANKILEEKTEKFTNVNKESLELILKPLGENIDRFKRQVEDVYVKESSSRKSLEDQVREMAKLNQIISEEAKNLTSALKGEAKTQGNWGEMILESILEKSGLRKDEQYFMEHQLMGEDGKPLRSDSENKKMRPDAVIKYPGNKHVIIDSKVSLNAFSRFLSASDKEGQEKELQMHISAIKNHVVSLSDKGYDDYDKALDFVMMFVPSEPAYIAAMQGDANLWNFAYEKRILLMNPTNLITSLKLIVDLWKREYQNQNAIEIASRGAKLYDKFVGFVKNLEGVGDHLDKAQGRYTEAYKQLSTGNDNLVLQATKLKNLGLKNKKELALELVSSAKTNELSE